MGLKENIDWAEKAVAEVKRYVQYSSSNQKADLVAANIQGWEAWKTMNDEQNKAVAASSFIGTNASVAQKVAFFNQQATPAPAPTKVPRGPRMNLLVEPSPIYGRMNALRDDDDALIAAGGDGRSMTRSAYDWYRGAGAPEDYHTAILAMSWASKQAMAGNCGELSAIAFTYLEDNGVHPLDYMVFTAPSYDHVWVTIGRAAGSNPLQLSTWGPDAVWCDPWQLREGRVYSIQDLISQKATNLDANYKLNSVELVQGGQPVSKWRLN